ncbi:hypothetical protein ACIP2X_37970 [Streptomyces sp. NPDC089424]|uniref:hypothetical protein n=1 Tax=Streptomyces sp. NPDC089424 TaxID=3365917 RepID=UPI003821F975
MDDKTRQAIAHLAEALHLLAAVGNQDEATVPVTIGDQQINVTPKTAEALADSVDSMNAYLGIEHPIDSELRDLADRIEEATDFDPDSMKRATARFMGWLQGQSGEAIESGEWSAAAVSQNDRELYADVTDFFDSIDPISLLDDVLSSDRPGQAAEAYEQMTGEWDGEL